MTEATEATRRLHAEALAVMSFDDDADFERAQRGLIATHPTGLIEEGGRTVWDIAQWDFVRESPVAPETVHPGLWRQARLNCLHGLYAVADGIWQVRGYDLSNITFIAGQTGWIVIDPLTTPETASASLRLANETLGERPVVAVIYTHSHVDHYGGVEGVVTRAAVAAGDVRVIAPVGFLREAISENVIAGPAMLRRSVFQFGPLLPKGPTGQVDAGLGKGVPAGSPTLIAPTEEITTTGEELVVDGVRIIFQNTPDAEAPAEMNFFFPDHGWLCMAENCTHTLHNIYPLRGAQVRDALAWSKYINEAMVLFGGDMQVLFASHHWPRFGGDDARTFLARQRDLYRFLNDQTMRLANRGYTAAEIAETIELPTCFHAHGDSHGYYGTVSHNVRSVYARYLGWYDANPAHLNPLPPEPGAAKYVEFMGGADRVVEQATASFERGDYRWVAEVLNHVIFADPSHQAARELQIATFEQLAFQAESATWRNAYLQGAQELRYGPPGLPMRTSLATFSAMTAEQVVDFIGVRFDPGAFEGKGGGLTLHFTDGDERIGMGVDEAAVFALPDESFAQNPCLRATRVVVGSIVTRAVSLDDAVASGDAVVDGDDDFLRRVLVALDGPRSMYAVVEP